MARPDYIVHHEHFQPHRGFVNFIQEYWGRAGLGRVPPLGNVQGEVSARINEGRWLADCPAGCGGALIVTMQPALFICVECGSTENGGNWYTVRLPPNKVAIEAVLLLRPASRPDHATTRNWIPGETVAQLKQENRDQGLPEE